MRVALYARVSSEEQVRNGISIDAQLAALREWAEKNEHIIIEEYVDNGVSARKAPAKRPALQKLLGDLQERKIELIAFTKLDRWTRNVKGYYAVQDVLDRHKVAWIAIQEDYETLTASGRFKVNIMLSVAENEADRTSERIKSVFEYKVARGEAISKKGLPVGYTIKDKRVVPDGRAPAIKAAFEYYERYGSIAGAMIFMRNEHGLTIGYNSLVKALKNRLYIGEYKDNATFCEPIIDRALFERVQQSMAKRSFRKNPSGRVYIFSGLVYCSECGRHFVGCYSGRNKLQNYRCTNAATERRCPNHRHISQNVLERYLLEHVGVQLDALRLSAEYQAKNKPHKQPDVAAINAKLERLKDLYVDGLIDKTKYLADRERLTKPLQQARDAPKLPDYEALRKIIGQDFQTRYFALSQQDKQAFWRSLLDRIEIYPDGTIRFYFTR